MISHTTCDHPATSKDRAKCRRAREMGMVHAVIWPAPPLYSLGPPPASVKVVDFTEEKERNQGTTPRDRHMQCDICGVERILYRGTNRYTDGPDPGMTITVGERCRYYLDPDLQIIALP